MTFHSRLKWKVVSYVVLSVLLCQTKWIEELDLLDLTTHHERQTPHSTVLHTGLLAQIGQQTLVVLVAS